MARNRFLAPRLVAAAFALALAGLLSPAAARAAGTYLYYCKIHGAAMTGTVYVVP